MTGIGARPRRGRTAPAEEGVQDTGWALPDQAPDPTLATVLAGGVEVPWCGAASAGAPRSAVGLAGDGEPIVLLPGLGWRATGCVVTETLGRGLPLVALDYPRRWPSRGLPSMGALARVYLAALDALHLERVHLAGVSAGGMLALRMTLEAPERVASLALVSTAAWGGGIGGAGRLATSLAVTRLLPPEPFGQFYRRFGPGLVGLRPHVADEECPRLWADPMSRRKMVDLLCGIRSFDLRPRLGEVRAPAIVVHGVEDRIFPLREAEVLTRGLPHAALVPIEGAGHFAFVTRRARVADELRRFWRGGNP